MSFNQKLIERMTRDSSLEGLIVFHFTFFFFFFVVVNNSVPLRFHYMISILSIFEWMKPTSETPDIQVLAHIYYSHKCTTKYVSG